jgi:uncharacterized membrane protein YgdD (TMEM256/DUF423 family)
MQSRTTLRLAGVCGAAAVLIGAFGAHGLKNVLSEAQLTIYETGVRYHAYHALALLVCGVRGSLRIAPWCMLLGILLFSGSLYALALSDIRWLGAITPLGGLAFVVGWLALGFETPRATAISAQVQTPTTHLG